MRIGKFAMVGLASLGCISAWSATATITPGTTHQTIEGFGGGVVYYQNWFTAQDTAVQRAMYDTAFTGLGVSIMRVGNWLQNDSTAKGLSMDSIIYSAYKARRPNGKVFMSSWSAPDTIKPSGSVNGNGQNASSTLGALAKPMNTLEKNADSTYKYAQFANWWKLSYQRYAAKGMAPDYISIQNEPDMNSSYAGTVYDPTENDTLAGYAQAFQAVRDTFTAAGIPAKMYGPEPLGIGYNNFQNYVAALTTAGQTPDGYSFHMYHNGVDNSTTAYSNPESFRSALKTIGSTYTTKPLIMSEYCHMNQSKPSSYDMIGLAQIMQIGFTDGNLSGYINWELLWGSDSAVGGQMISVSKPASWGGIGKFTVNPEYHAMRHFSRFVNPGWVRIDASSDNANIKPVAFKSADADSITMVFVNGSASTQIPVAGYGVTGFHVSNIIQTVTGGEMSKVLPNATCVALPPSSITTIVLVSGTETLGSADCGSEVTVIPAYTATPSGVVLSNPIANGITGWSASNTKVSVVAATTGTNQSIAKVTFSGAAQATAGYSNINYDMSSITTDLSVCQTVSVSAYNGGAAAVSMSMSINDVYAATASLPIGTGNWTTVQFSLGTKKLGTKLSFNSDQTGPMYVANITALGCETGAGSTVVIHDFTTGDLGTWTASATTAPSIKTTALDGQSTYLYLPLSGCDQSTCGYKNILFSNDVLTNNVLSKCQSVVIHAHADTTSSSLNVGATGTAWIDYGYGYSVALTDGWKDLTIPLVKEGTNASTKLKFNSNSTGIYISTITATGCATTSAILDRPVPQSTITNSIQAVYDLQGRLVWNGAFEKAQLKAGLYIVRVHGVTLTKIKK